MTNRLTEQQAATLLHLQAGMNAKVDPDCVAAAYPYLRAVIIEASEAIEHHGWKWWKKQHCDLPQLQMELIDIWHFLLSEILLRVEGDERLALEQLMSAMPENWRQEQLVFDGKTLALAEPDLLQKLELLIGTAAAGRIEIPLFNAILEDCQMDWQDLYAQYVGKNVLNFFRQDNGYKEGTYVKIWSEREDNEHLVEAMQCLDPLHTDFQGLLYAELERRYSAYLK